jgi:hypothetical protein
MGILVDNIQWVLLAAGLLTCSMIQATIAPRATVRTYFGEAPDSPQFDLVVRNWGMLITAAGALLIWASFAPDVRLAAIALAIVTKSETKYDDDAAVRLSGDVVAELEAVVAEI